MSIFFTFQMLHADVFVFSCSVYCCYFVAFAVLGGIALGVDTGVGFCVGVGMGAVMMLLFPLLSCGSSQTPPVFTDIEDRANLLCT